MTLEPLFAAGPIIVLHTFAAMAAFLIGVVQLVGVKGTSQHRALGWLWVMAMVGVAVSSFWIHGMKQFGNFSWIHGLSIFTLLMLPLGVMAARRQKISTHGTTMVAIFVGALVVTGAFTLLPGRVMHQVVFGAN